MVELDTWRYHKKVNEIYEIIELEKNCALITRNPSNFSIHQIINISFVLYNTYIVFRDQNKVVFLINNTSDCNQFNQLYDLNRMKKDIQNANIVICKLRMALIRAIYYRLDNAKEEQQNIGKNGENTENRNYGCKTSKT